MSDLRFTTGDVAAATDVLVDVADYSDTMTPEQCVEFRIACEAVVKAARDAISFLDMQFVKIAETDVILDGRRFYVSRRKESERFDHDAITAAILRIVGDLVSDGAGAELTEADRILVSAGARTAIDLMARVYVSEATRARIGGLNALGIPCDKNNPGTVRSWQPGDKYVAIVPAGGER